MINLEKTSGLPISIDDQYHLVLNSPTVRDNAAVARTFTEMKPVLMDDSVKPEREETYYMYRNIYFDADHEKIVENHLDYDITIVPPTMLGKEYNKTLGHYHANIPGTTIAHP